MAEYLSWDVESEAAEKIKPLIREIAQQRSRIRELEAALEGFLIAHDNATTAPDDLVDRMAAIGAEDVWYSSEVDLQTWAAEKAREVLAKGKT